MSLLNTRKIGSILADRPLDIDFGQTTQPLVFFIVIYKSETVYFLNTNPMPVGPLGFAKVLCKRFCVAGKLVGRNDFTSS